MVDWDRLRIRLAGAIESARREGRLREVPLVQATRTECLYWNCRISIRADHVFCYEHWQDFQEGLIDECSGCGRAKDEQYDLCLDCFNDPAKSRGAGRATTYSWYEPEYSPAWDKADASARRFFVYVLKLDSGGFYAGQTRELRERLSEHRDGRVQSTVGRNPRLVWFSIVSSRAEATTRETELKKLIDTNPRAIRRLVLDFQDLTKELDYS